MRRFAIAIAVWVALGLPALAEDRLVIFAAASLKTALDAAAAEYHREGGLEAVISYGGSLGLARQLVAGAPADIFGSADEPSMDAAVAGKAIREGTRADLLTNRLVLVAPKSAAFDTLALEPDALAKALGTDKLSTGEVNTVPAGKYAKAALTKLGLWDVVSPHLAMSDNVRAAMGYVSRGEAPLGIVYATDAHADPSVKIVAEFPADSHPPIAYPFAIVATSHNSEAPKFLDYLKSPAAAAIFKAQGFGVDK